MRVRTVVVTLAVVVSIAALLRAEVAHAQATPAGPAAAPKAASVPKAAPGAHADGNLLQVMRGILFPNSNVIFFAQGHDPAKIKADATPEMSTNPLTGTYGGWEAVQNSSIALAEAANLLSIPGRVCSNGRPVPVQNPDWIADVQGLREAGMAAYKAAKSKNQDAIVDVSEKVTDACSKCHNVYREKTDKQGGMASRCLKQ